MRILLDENFPADFAKLLVDQDVSTVHSLGWSGVKKGSFCAERMAFAKSF
jgi:predicted nuclease of predicted toxin-antitoxin system